jgi:hypothetical protein
MYPLFESVIRTIGTITGLRAGRPRNMGSILYSGRRVFSILMVLSKLLRYVMPCGLVERYKCFRKAGASILRVLVLGLI